METSVMGRRSRWVAGIVAVVMLSVCSVAFCFGCGTEGRSALDQLAAEQPVETTGSTDVADDPSSEDPSSEDGLPDDPVPEGVVGEVDPDVSSAFEQVAAEITALPVYVPTYLPADTELAVQWWPIAECGGPEEYTGPAVANPRIDMFDKGEGSAQVIMRRPTGWLAVLENFRGDLGDTPSEEVGQVQGRDARLYDLEGDTVVQWSDEGCWYAVVGKGVERTEVIKVALSMKNLGK